jgi:hypothetical protein
VGETGADFVTPPGAWLETAHGLKRRYGSRFSRGLQSPALSYFAMQELALSRAIGLVGPITPGICVLHEQERRWRLFRGKDSRATFRLVPDLAGWWG